MKLISWNVNGLRSAFTKGLVSFLSEHQPDIFCIQESKSQIDQLHAEQLSPLNYRSHHSCALKKGYSGVATYVKDSLTPLKVEHGIGIPEFDNEGRFIITHFENFSLYNIYFPSGTTGDIRQRYKYEFLDALTAHISTLSEAEQERLIICGDFNICHRDIDIHHPEKATALELSGFLPEERAWMDRFVELGFTDCFRHMNGPIPQRYTWWTFRAGARAKNLGWRIDYFFVHHKLAPLMSNAEILSHIPGSDHVPVVIDLALQS